MATLSPWFDRAALDWAKLAATEQVRGRSADWNNELPDRLVKEHEGAIIASGEQK